MNVFNRNPKGFLRCVMNWVALNSVGSNKEDMRIIMDLTHQLFHDYLTQDERHSVFNLLKYTINQAAIKNDFYFSSDNYINPPNSPVSEPEEQESWVKKS